MRWLLLMFLGFFSVGCSTGALTNTPVPTVDVAATVESAVEATRVAERAVNATEDAREEATREATPTATPVVMTIYVPTPEPYVAAPGSIEKGVEEFYLCLKENERFRSFYLSGMEQAGLSSDSTGNLTDSFLTEKDGNYIGF